MLALLSSHLSSTPGGRVQVVVVPYEPFYAFYKALPEDATGSQVELASRLLHRSLAVTNLAKVVKISLSIRVSASACPLNLINLIFI